MFIYFNDIFIFVFFYMKTSFLKPPGDKPKAAVIIIEHFDLCAWAAGKDKKTVIHNIHIAEACNKNWQSVNLFTHILILCWNINMLYFIHVNNHKAFTIFPSTSSVQEISCTSIFKVIISVILSVSAAGIKWLCIFLSDLELPPVSFALFL